MNRRSFLGGCAALLPAVALARYSNPFVAASYDASRWEHYNHFEWARRKRAHLLANNERWLTPDDRMQKGDCYLASKDWWDFKGPHSSIGEFGQPIPLDVFCYTPKGLKERK